jgi:hypothetical protein
MKDIAQVLITYKKNHLAEARSEIPIVFVHDKRATIARSDSSSGGKNGL